MFLTDIRVDWEAHNVIEGDKKLTVTYCKLITLIWYIVLTDIRVDWEAHNVLEGDNKLIDLITTYGKPFPLKDSDDNEIVPPTERKYFSHILAYSKACVKWPLKKR